MSGRTWYIAIDGKQAGPYPEDQFMEFIANGQVDRNALVWSEGMSAWQRAGYVPGLFAPVQPPPQPAGAPPPSAPQRSPMVRLQPNGPTGSFGGGAVALSGDHLDAEFSALPLFGRTLLYVIGMALIVTAPWAAASYYRWIVPRIRVPGRPDLAFEGKAGDIWWVFVLMALPGLGGIFALFLTVKVIRWILSNLSSEGRRLGLTFTGGVWGYIGWLLLFIVSIYTIIGWAWVVAAATRWFCRHVQGTTRRVSFTGTGWQVLWRTWVFSFACAFIIPIPWMMRWYYRWFISQIALA
jgi:hypothetical protein